MFYIKNIARDPSVAAFLQVLYIFFVMCIISEAGTAYPSGAHHFNPGFSGLRVTRSLVVYVCFLDHCLSFCTFYFGHCVVCSSSIYGF